MQNSRRSPPPQHRRRPRADSGRRAAPPGTAEGDAPAGGIAPAAAAPGPADTGDAPTRAIEPGLHFVATPIGAARDITLRALDILAGADVLAAEDTRSLRRLMEIHGIRLGGRPLLAYHDHNGAAMRPRLLAALAAGKSVAFMSEAGTPLVADPGYQLARAAIEAGHTIRAAPGASALLAALAVAGLPTDRFLFAGFLPHTRAARRRAIASLAPVEATLVLFESPRRVRETLGDLCEGLGTERRAAVCRELTKRFEDVTRGTLAELHDRFAAADPRGECVIVIDRAAASAVAPGAVDAALQAALATDSVGAAAGAVAAAFGIPRREAYARALALREAGDRRVKDGEGTGT